MKTKVLALIFLSAVAVASNGENDGLQPVGQLLSAHIRCHARSGASIGFEYGDEDFLKGYRFFEMKSKGDSGYDDFRSHLVELRFGHFADGIETTDSVSQFSLKTVSSGKDAAISACLRPAGSSMRLAVGGDEIEKEYIIPDVATPTCCIRHRKNDKASMVFENDLVMDYVPDVAPRSYSPLMIDSIAMMEYVDGIEGVWCHYEQSSDPLRVSDARRYTLGCVATPEGYELFIIDCKSRRDDSGHDRPGAVKALLTPTSMDGIFEMKWFDAHGNSLGSDNTAAFEGNLLTLSFPRWETEVRYIRQR